MAFRNRCRSRVRQRPNPASHDTTPGYFVTRACSRFWVGFWYGVGMEITQEQYERIAHCFPTQRGNVKLSNLVVLNAILYVTEHGSSGVGCRPGSGGGTLCICG